MRSLLPVVVLLAVSQWPRYYIEIIYDTFSILTTFEERR